MTDEASVSGVSAQQPGKPPRGASPRKGRRRNEILQSLAHMLESSESSRITTAALAAQLNISEAALYRHFASKAQMFDGLVDFIETTLLSLVNQITASAQGGCAEVRSVTVMLLTFAEKNPGLTRVLTGDALVHEDSRVQARVNKLISRLTLAIKQCIRSGVSDGSVKPDANPSELAEILMSFVVGRWLLYVRSDFKLPISQGADWIPNQFAAASR